MNRYNCQYAVGSNPPCPNEKTLDFEFCREHMKTPRGRQHAIDVVSIGNLTLPSEVRSAVESAAALPEKDIQTSTLEKMAEALDRILEWESESRNRLYEIPREDWRYLSRERTEQKRTELTVYENAQERVMRALATTSKMALKDKMVSLGKAQSELMIRILTSVIGELQLNARDNDLARQLLLQKLRSEANLPSRVQATVVGELESSNNGR